MHTRICKVYPSVISQIFYFMVDFKSTQVYGINIIIKNNDFIKTVTLLLHKRCKKLTLSRMFTNIVPDIQTCIIFV